MPQDIKETGQLVEEIPRDIYKYVDSDPLGDLPRYSVHIVIQHFIVFATFLVLASTGFPLHFPDAFWAPVLISFYGGADSARLIHRIAAFLMIAGGVYHLLTITLGTIQKIFLGTFDIKRTQIPMLTDLRNLIDDIKYFLGITHERPRMEKFM